MSCHKSISYFRADYEKFSSEDLDLIDYLYGKLRTMIIKDREKAEMEFNCTWRYYYKGYCELDTQLCHLEVSYGPDLNEEWIIKRANI